MPTYLLFSTLTPEGRHTMHANPDRLFSVNHEVEEFGCKVIAQYATLGEFDFVTVVEADDSETIAHLSIDLGSRGTVSVMSVQALSVRDLQAKLKGHDQLAASPVVGGETSAGSSTKDDRNPDVTPVDPALMHR